MPVVAIGGITYDNMDKVKDTGVSGIAVVSALFGADNPGAATRKMKGKCDKIFNYNPRNIILIWTVRFLIQCLTGDILRESMH